MDKGWIKLNRKIQEHWIWDNPEKFRAWIDLLLMANHEKKKVEMREGLVTVNRGQLVTSIGKLAHRWGWSKEKVYRYLKTLECDGMLTRKSNAFKTVLTIVNYDKYQGRSNADESTDESTDKSSNESTDESRTRMNKNVKEEKEKPAALPSEKDQENDYDPEDDGLWYTGDELLEMSKKGLI